MAPSIIEFLNQVQAFSAVSDKTLKKLAAAAELRSFSPGDPVMTEGDPGDGLCIVYSGKFRLFKLDDDVEQSIGLRGVGELVGEMGALRELPVAYSVRAASRSELLVIPRAKVNSVLEEDADAKRFVTQYVVISSAGEFIGRFLNLKQGTERQDIERIVNSIGIKQVTDGQTIFEQGSKDDLRLYVVESGLIRLERKQGDNEFTVGLLGGAEIFGERGALEGMAQPESAIAAAQSVVFIIPRDILALIIEHNPALENLLKERIARRDREYVRQQKLARRRRPRVLLDLFTPKGWGHRVLDHFPLAEQTEEADCGAACISMVCSYYNISVSMAKLRELTGEGDGRGAMAKLAHAGEALGFNCKNLTCTTKMIKSFDLPFVAQWEGYHYVVVYGISSRYVWIADPAKGFSRMPIAEFERGWNGMCLTFVPTESIQSPETDSGNPWIRFVRYLVPHRTMIRDIFLATMVVELLGLVSPLLTQAIVDKVLVHANLHLLNILVVGAGIALVFTNMTRILRSYLINFLIRKIDFAMMSHFYKHILALPVAFFARRKVGDIMACFNENKKIRQFLTYTAINAVLNLFMFVVYLGVMLIFNIQLSLVFLAFVPVLVLLTAYATPRYKENARRNFFAEAKARSVLTESLNAAETIKGMGVELAMRVKWEKEYVEALNRQYRAEFFTSKIRSLSRVINSALILTILWFGARLVISKDLTVGQLMAFTQLVGCVMIPFMALIDSWGQLHAAGVSIERLGEVLDLPMEQSPEDLPSRIVLGNFTGSLRFENVSFRYGGPESSIVLQNIGLSLKPGKTYAVIGPSGSGKTTLCKLIIGLYAPTEGAIYADGFDRANVDLTMYRAQTGYVLQNNTLFSGTLAENIALGDPDPDYRRIVHVGRMAEAQGFVRRNPLGYELALGERGSGLSSAQQQCICIARALYPEPRLLVLDEAMSAQDPDAEERILTTLTPDLTECTTVIVPQRAATLKRVDRIFVIEDGTIVEAGSHQELMDRRGAYSALFSAQFS